MNKEKVMQRLKNLYFWLGIAGILMMQLGISDAHSWMEIGNVLLDLVKDPARLLSTVMMMTAVWVDPSTPGFADRENLEDKIEKSK